MKTNPKRILLVLGVLALITACDKPKTQAEVDRNVAEKQTDVAKDLVDAKHEAVSTMTAARNDALEDIQDADHKTTQAQGALLKATADANYKLAVEAASGEREVAATKCESMASDLQKACKDRAGADFAAAKTQAEANRSAKTPSQT